MPTKLRICGSGTNRYKIEQLEALLEEKKKQVAKLEKRRQILEQRQQMVSMCIDQQGDMLHALGQMMFTLPDSSDEEFERKATAAVEALLKDMEVAQLMQAADSSSNDSADTTASLGAPAEQQQQQQQHPGEQQQPQQQRRQEPYTARVLRNFLESPNYLETMRRLQSATVEELADNLRLRYMELGFAVSTYPWKTYKDAYGNAAPQPDMATPSSNAAAAAAARLGSSACGSTLQDPAAQRRQRAHERLEDAIETVTREVLLLHLVRDKVLKLSVINMDTKEDETPSASFWEDVAEQIQIRPDQMQQLHAGFVWYNSKRAVLTRQMQQTVQELQQLLGASDEESEVQQLAAAAAAGGCEPFVGHAGSRSSSAKDAWPVVDINGNSPKAAVWSTSIVGDFADYVTLERLEDADRLLQQLGRQVWQLREVSRCLIFLFANTLDPLQLSRSAVYSWPFLMQPPPIVEALVKWELHRQQQAEEQQQNEQEQEVAAQAAAEEEDLGQV